MKIHNPRHKCPNCGEWHYGSYEVCSQCITDDNMSKMDPYDYVGDDREYDKAKGS